MPATPRPQPAARAGWGEYLPKLVTCLREGYGPATLGRDALAGLTVAVVALPLAMALAIASGASPEQGLVTAVVAGFLISALGGSRYQIGGPTGAFVVIVFDVIARHGYDGLVLATLMAGVLLLLFAAARLGTAIQFIPYPVVTGFTAGIAVVIASSQVKDFFGLSIPDPPGDVLGQWQRYLQEAHSFSWLSLMIGAGALALIVLLRRKAPRLPSFLIAVALAATLVALLDLPVPTIGSRFGALPSFLPAPALPEVTLERLATLFPDALTIALLAGIESLLSAVIADGMTGERHRSNAELIAQGTANIASALFGGLPATGAIARTVTNIESGGRTPLAGIFHALFLLAFLLLFAPLAVYAPLPALASVLLIVAWNMSELQRFRHLLKAPPGDRVVLLLTFALTVLVDLTLAIQVGIVLAALIFMRRMAEVTEIEAHHALFEPEVTGGTTRLLTRDDIPAGVEVFQINGPFFFGVATRLQHILEQVRTPPEVFILRMRRVPLVDATGARSLADFIDKCRRRGTEVILTAVNRQPREVLDRLGFEESGGHLVPDLEAGLALARDLIAARARAAAGQAHASER
ncbi:MAG: SulP family inorganic anion transporter [Kiloniellales bacterium]